MPEFKAREAARAEQKRRELAPFIEAALARKPRMAPIAAADIPLGRSLRAARRRAAIATSDRGGAISIPTADPLARNAAK